MRKMLKIHANICARKYLRAKIRPCDTALSFGAYHGHDPYILHTVPGSLLWALMGSAAVAYVPLYYIPVEIYLL